MVRVPSPVRALDRKLLRDLWAMKGQAIAIALVVAAGVAMFVAYMSNFESLQRTRAAFFGSARFADVFASLVRAPTHLEARLASIPGIDVVATRVVADVTLDVPGMAEPATGRVISVPARGRPPLNDLHLRRGRWIDPARAGEVLASEMFCDAHGLEPGDRIAAIINGRRRQLTIVGIALSPEYVYAIRAGEIVPDARRYGVFWMERRELAAAFDMEGGFNDVALALARGGSEAAVIAEVDRLLQPFGGRGAIPQRLQASAWTLENELAQLQLFGFLVPAIFLGVAAFILHVALTRALALQRTQIAALKALGYSNRELAWHYIKWALAIAGAGSLAGAASGAWLGSALIGIYNEFFRFPALVYHLSTPVTVQSIAGSLAVAALGAHTAVRHAVAVPPAEAMRPQPPTGYRRSVFEIRWRPLRLSLAARMVLRNVTRQPLRAAMSVIGIAFAVAVLLVGLGFIDVIDTLLEREFTAAMRQDATLTLVEPRAARAVHDFAHLPGVMEVEPMRIVPVRFGAGTRTRTSIITAMPAAPTLNRVIDRRRGALPLPADGLLLSQMLADVLGVEPGDRLTVEVLEGRRPVRSIEVAELVDDAIGLQAYMRLDQISRVVGDGPTLSGAALTIDPAARDRFYAEVKVMPAVAGVALRELTLQNFRQTMAESMNVSIFINVLFAGLIAFGVVYNSARVSLSERSRELASLRVLGFTRAEIAAILLGELALLTVVALPLGAAIGYALGVLIVAAFNNEIYRMTFAADAATVAWAWLTAIAATLVSALIVRHRLDRLDLVAVLKTRE
jgi:putative ABC transport system permease protein